MQFICIITCKCCMIKNLLSKFIKNYFYTIKFCIFKSNLVKLFENTIKIKTAFKFLVRNGISQVVSVFTSNKLGKN